MINGKKSIAENIFNNTLMNIKKRTNEDPIQVFLAAIRNVLPYIGTKAIRKRRKVFQIPVALKKKKQMTLVIK